MTKRECLKLVLGTMSYIGAGSVAGAYITTAPFVKMLNPAMRLCVWVGGYALKDLAGEKAYIQIEKTVDQVVDAIKTVTGSRINMEGENIDDR